jgi:hypothetical protein
VLLLKKPQQPDRVINDLATSREQIVAQIKAELSYMFASVLIDGENYRCFKTHYSEAIYQAALDRMVKARLSQHKK